MKVIIIEDEPLIAETLQEMVVQADPTIRIISILGSIREAVAFFEREPLPDLFFSDIQLSDGLSFEIFKTLPDPVPVIFCTAYDQYALDAFRANGIDYVLKPFDPADIRAALTKTKALQRTMPPPLLDQIRRVEQLLRPAPPPNILIKKGDRITPVKATSVAIAFLENGIVYVYSLSGERFATDYTLDQLAQQLGSAYFRVNRQALIQREAIRHVSHYFARKLLVKPTIDFPHQLIVSKANATTFLRWLEGSAG